MFTGEFIYESSQGAPFIYDRGGHHHADFTSLEASGTTGCHICVLIMHLFEPFEPEELRKLRAAPSSEEPFQQESNVFFLFRPPYSSSGPASNRLELTIQLYFPATVGTPKSTYCRSEVLTLLPVDSQSSFMPVSKY